MASKVERRARRAICCALGILLICGMAGAEVYLPYGAEFGCTLAQFEDTVEPVFKEDFTKNDKTGVIYSYLDKQIMVAGYPAHIYALFNKDGLNGVTITFDSIWTDRSGETQKRLEALEELQAIWDYCAEQYELTQQYMELGIGTVYCHIPMKDGRIDAERISEYMTASEQDPLSGTLHYYNVCFGNVQLHMKENVSGDEENGEHYTCEIELTYFDHVLETVPEAAILNMQ